MPIDGFEMYNLHANAFLGVGALLDIIGHLKDADARLPQPDLFLLPVVSEDPELLATWGSVLARGAHRVTTMGTDCHRNSLPQILPDGERIDSYERMMAWFSNHLLVRSGRRRHVERSLGQGGAAQRLGCRNVRTDKRRASTCTRSNRGDGALVV